MILLRTLVATDNIVVENGLDIPALLLCHLCKMLAAVQSLFFASHGQKNDRAGKLQLAQHARALEADGRAAGVVVGAGRIAFRVERVAVSRIVVARDQNNPLGILRIATFQHRINIGELRRLWDAVGSAVRESCPS